MAYTVKDWRNEPDHSTPINAPALEDMETRLSAYTDGQVSALNSRLLYNAKAYNVTGSGSDESTAIAAFYCRRSCGSHRILSQGYLRRLAHTGQANHHPR
jgi:hypothetical protein